LKKVNIENAIQHDKWAKNEYGYKQPPLKLNISKSARKLNVSMSKRNMNTNSKLTTESQ